MKGLPADILKYAEDYYFSKELVDCLSYLNCLGFNIQISVARFEEYYIRIDITSHTGDHESFNVKIPYATKMDKVQEIYDETAKLIKAKFCPKTTVATTLNSLSLSSRPVFKDLYIDNIKVHGEPINVDVQNFYNKVLTEIKSRGDFNINISKLVDLLFKLGVIEENTEVKNDDF